MTESDPSLILDPIELIGETLSQKHGHLFYIKNIEDVKNFVSNIDKNNLLTKRQIALLKSICFAHQSKTNFCTVSQAERNMDQSRDGINKSINFFIKQKIINPLDIKLSVGVMPPRTKSFSFIHKSEFLNVLSALEAKSSNKKTNQKKEGISETRTNVLKKYNLPNSVTENEIQRGMFPSQLPPFEKMLPNKSFTGKTHITEVTIKNRKVIVEAKSTEKLMTDDDLKTLYTLMTLSINQQANLVAYYLTKNCDPINSHYIEIRHLLKVLNKGSSGSYYDSFVKSITRIKETVFNLHQLEEMFTDELGERFFASPEFRFFESCTPISKEGPIIVSDVENNNVVKIKPFGFIIKWNDELFKKMLTDKYFFVIPLKILSAQTLIFLFYIFLRNQFSFERTRTIHYTIDELHRKLNSSAMIHNFKRDFTSSLNNWNKSKGKFPSNSEIIIDLQGFFITVNIENDLVTDVKCRIDAQKMLSYVGLQSDENGLTSKGTLAAPTTLNPMLRLAPLLSFAKSRGDEFPSQYNMRLLLNNKNLLKNIDISKTNRKYIHLKKGTFRTKINFYTEDSKLLTICEKTHVEKDLQAAFFSHLQTLRSKLLPLGWRNGRESYEISKDTFHLLQQALYKDHGKIIEGEHLYDLLLERSQLVKIIATSWNDKNSKVLSNQIYDLYNQNSNVSYDMFTDINSE